MASGWDNIGSKSSSTDSGEVERPPAKAMCAKCNRRRLMEEMQPETNHRSGAYGLYVCADDWRVGGCFEGPYPEEEHTLKPVVDEGISPVYPGLFY